MHNISNDSDDIKCLYHNNGYYTYEYDNTNPHIYKYLRGQEVYDYINYYIDAYHDEEHFFNVLESRILVPCNDNVLFFCVNTLGYYYDKIQVVEETINREADYTVYIKKNKLRYNVSLLLINTNVYITYVYMHMLYFNFISIDEVIKNNFNLMIFINEFKNNNSILCMLNYDVINYILSYYDLSINH